MSLTKLKLRSDSCLIRARSDHLGLSFKLGMCSQSRQLRIFVGIIFADAYTHYDSLQGAVAGWISPGSQQVLWLEVFHEDERDEL